MLFAITLNQRIGLCLTTKHNSEVGLLGSDRLSRVNLSHLNYVLNFANSDLITKFIFIAY